MYKRTFLRFAFSGLKTFNRQLPFVNHTPTPYTGSPFEQIIKDRTTYMPSFYFHYYKTPLLLVQGHLQYLYDHKGRRYLDLSSGISTVSCGHSHPEIVKVIT